MHSQMDDQPRQFEWSSISLGSLLTATTLGFDIIKLQNVRALPCVFLAQRRNSLLAAVLNTEANACDLRANAEPSKSYESAFMLWNALLHSLLDICMSDRAIRRRSLQNIWARSKSHLARSGRQSDL